MITKGGNEVGRRGIPSCARPCILMFFLEALHTFLGRLVRQGLGASYLDAKKGGDLRTPGEEGLSNKTAQGQKDLAPCEQSLGFGRR